MKSKYKKRRRRLVRPSLQLRLIGTFLGIATLAMLVQLVLLGQKLAIMAGTMPEEGAQLSTEIPGLLSSVALVSFAVLLPCTLVCGIAVTFRIAGPVHRFESHLRSLCDGGDPGELRLRADDELQDLCELINQALDLRASSKSSEPRHRAA